MSYEEQVADQLRAVNFDLTRLSDEDRARVFLLARKAGVEIWHGQAWGSHRDAERYGQEATRVDPCRP